ncbi:MAG: DUF294 nucleotidyltransferase-like domain-containing protein [Flavobacteriaceae bacterium]|nr:DUF294 nucleotidyltransferase-like domain-containing protein [Flavobacteriaceae bacterium]
MKNTIAERIYDFLKNFPPFDALKKEQLLKIAAQVKVIYVENESFIFKQEEKPNANFYVVKEGAIGLFRSVEKDNILVDKCDEGDIFGLRALIQNDIYALSAKTKEESILYAISVELLHEIIETNERAKKFLIACYSTNIKSPYAKNSKGQLFANEDVLQLNKSNINDIQTVNFHKNPVSCTKNISIKEAAQIMCSKRVGSILIVEKNKPIGIITDKDLRVKIATGKISINDKITKIMSSPVITSQEGISVAEAQIAMLKHKITHLCITKDGTPNSNLIGILSEHDIVVLHGNNPSVLVKELKRATNVNSLRYIKEKANNLLKGYIEQDIPISFILKIISEINDVLAVKAIGFSVDEMPFKPPVKFTWLALGSQGRHEQLLVTDQDNALIFENVSKENYKSTQLYFIKLAKKITKKLHFIGYDYCPAKMMASNPNWCQSISVWKNQFNKWITTPTDEAIMMCTIFFDYSLIYGDKTLVDSLSDNIFKSIGGFEVFLNFLGKNALKNPPPLSFFRQFLVEQDGKHKDQFDLKSRALMPLIDAARLIALSHHIKNVSGTISRYEKLIELEPKNKDLYQSCIDSFKILIRYRTKQGLKNGNSGRFVNLAYLSKSEKLKLKGCFKPINAIQELLNIRYNLSQMM